MGTILVSVIFSYLNPNSDIDSLTQFLLLWWSKHPHLPGAALPSVLLQHHVGRHEEGSRAIELFH